MVILMTRRMRTIEKTHMSDTLMMMVGRRSLRYAVRRRNLSYIIDELEKGKNARFKNYMNL